MGFSYEIVDIFSSKGQFKKGEYNDSSIKLNMFLMLYWEIIAFIIIYIKLFNQRKL